MLKNNTEFLIQILDDYSSGVTNSLEVLAKLNNISVRSLFVWMRDPAIIIPEYMGRQNITFGQAMTMARNVMKVVTVGRTLEEYVLRGREVQVWHHGEPTYEDDEQAILIEDLDMREMIYGFRDGKKRDANGNRIIRTRIEYAPAQLIEKYAASNMPGVYGNKSEVTMKGQVSLGVTRMPSAPLPPEVQALIAGEITETVKLAPPIGATTDTPEQYGPEPVLNAPVTAPEPERVIRDLPIASETPPPQEGILAPKKPIPAGWRAEWDKLAEKASPTGQGIFDKLKSARERSQQ